MTTIHTPVFKSNENQAIGLPKLVALLGAIKIMDVVTTAVKHWDQWLNSLGISDGFMLSREHKALQKSLSEYQNCGLRIGCE